MFCASCREAWLRVVRQLQVRLRNLRVRHPRAQPRVEVLVMQSQPKLSCLELVMLFRLQGLFLPLLEPVI